MAEVRTLVSSVSFPDEFIAVFCRPFFELAVYYELVIVTGVKSIDEP